MHVKYNPYVFTEQGIYMLMTVLIGSIVEIREREGYHEMIDKLLEMPLLQLAG